MEKAIERIKQINYKKIWAKSRAISLVVAGVTIMVATVIFIFLTDLFAKNNSQWLMISALIGFSAGAAALLSEINKENKILIYVLKGISLVLMVGFVIYLYKFMDSSIYASIKPENVFGMFRYNKNGEKGYRIAINCLKGMDFTMVVTFICTYLSIAAQVFNITSNAIQGIEE